MSVRSYCSNLIILVEKDSDFCCQICVLTKYELSKITPLINVGHSKKADILQQTRHANSDFLCFLIPTVTECGKISETLFQTGRMNQLSSVKQAQQNSVLGEDTGFQKRKQTGMNFLWLHVRSVPLIWKFLRPLFKQTTRLMLIRWLHLLRHS